MTKTEEFGCIIDGVEYVPRLAAYAVVRGEGGAVAVVRAAGGCFLPCGGDTESAAN